ncbi:putative acetyltransferase [Botrimarina colliarenosi]|uniref:Putative acetyltransferase n=1 Tax=Botrimarina colliarenosi TaxID=2528001 RepID=A0A5C6AD89_9BACT|nr:GNAT family N-acetyltransferase [Botrimarina colliarenosi]TWT98022.1 putative acetyltransferase [Botrimarina colliarenosi]
MFEIRPFRNSDPPALAEIWQSQPPQRGLAQPVNSAVLELCVYSKQMFDPSGLLVATRDGRPIGFVHAGFGPDDRGEGPDTMLGTTHLLMLQKGEEDDALADELIVRSEEYQRSRGATVHYAGGIRPLDAFYLGLYGGSELPGVLESDQRQLTHFLRNHYRETSRVVVLQRDLVRFRFGGPRETRQIKRDTSVEQTFMPPPRHWWEACVTCGQDRMRFALRDRSTGAEIAHVVFWDIEPLATSWGIPTVGMTDLWVDPSHRRRKAATHLLNEALRIVQRRGAAMVEAQTMAENAAGLALYQSIGFTAIDNGLVLRRDPRG